MELTCRGFGAAECSGVERLTRADLLSAPSIEEIKFGTLILKLQCYKFHCSEHPNIPFGHGFKGES